MCYFQRNEFLKNVWWEAWSVPTVGSNVPTLISIWMQMGPILLQPLSNQILTIRKEESRVKLFSNVYLCFLMILLTIYRINLSNWSAFSILLRKWICYQVFKCIGSPAAELDLSAFQPLETPHLTRSFHDSLEFLAQCLQIKGKRLNIFQHNRSVFGCILPASVARRDEFDRKNISESISCYKHVIEILKRHARQSLIRITHQ